MRESVLHIAVSLMCLGLIVVFGILPEPFRTYTAMLEPALFFALLCGILNNEIYGLIVGVLAPFLVYLLLGESAFMPGVLVRMITYGLTGLMGGFLYRYLQYGWAAVLAALLLSRVAYGVSGAVLYYFSGGSYVFMEFIQDMILSVWPGLLLSGVGLPLLIHALQGLGVMQVLRPNLNYEGNEK